MQSLCCPQWYFLPPLTLSVLGSSLPPLPLNIWFAPCLRCGTRYNRAARSGSSHFVTDTRATSLPRSFFLFHLYCCTCTFCTLLVVAIGTTSRRYISGTSRSRLYSSTQIILLSPLRVAGCGSSLATAVSCTCPCREPKGREGRV